MSDNTTDFNFLQGVKVVDFTQFEAGTTCTEVLAWFGAEVVKIENPKTGDPGRRLRPGKPDDDPFYFQVFNANKKSITVNLKSPRGLALVKDLLGEDVIAWGSHFFCKMPGDGKAVAWHQDASYWPLSAARTVTVWLAIDDADRENACMRFLAGSHHYGHLTYRPSDPAEHNVLNQTIERPEQYGTPVAMELKAGEASIHCDLLLHGSEANMSTRRRCGLTLRYCAASVRADLGWNGKGVVVSGSDPSGHWANPPRPEAS